MLVVIRLLLLPLLPKRQSKFWAIGKRTEQLLEAFVKLLVVDTLHCAPPTQPRLACPSLSLVAFAAAYLTENKLGLTGTLQYSKPYSSSFSDDNRSYQPNFSHDQQAKQRYRAGQSKAAAALQDVRACATLPSTWERKGGGAWFGTRSL